MNVLFVLYHDFTANSASQVAALANELIGFGHDCAVAVPKNVESISCLGSTRFHVIDFADFDLIGGLFDDGSGPDIVHAWTPREVVRRFAERVVNQFGSLLYVHLEDNEWHILTCLLSRSFADLRSLDEDQLDAVITSGLSHPVRANEFMTRAFGVTVIIDRLADLTPKGTRTLELWPAADGRIFFPTPMSKVERSLYRVPENSVVIAYTGNVHAANAHEVRSLYLAVALLNRSGLPTTLVRAGRDYFPFLGPDARWADSFCINLGMIPHYNVRSVLSLADVLIQPGKADIFNDYRFPSKLPEYLSIGRPLILPRSNIGRLMTHREHGFLLEDSSAVGITEAVQEIMKSPELYANLSAGALAFSSQHLSWEKSAQKLENFYLEGREEARHAPALLRKAARC